MIIAMRILKQSLSVVFDIYLVKVVDFLIRYNYKRLLRENIVCVCIFLLYR